MITKLLSDKDNSEETAKFFPSGTCSVFRLGRRRSRAELEFFAHFPAATIVIVVAIEIVQGGENDRVEDFLQVLLSEGATLDVGHCAYLPRHRNRLRLRHGSFFVIRQFD